MKLIMDNGKNVGEGFLKSRAVLVDVYSLTVQEWTTQNSFPYQ